MTTVRGVLGRVANAVLAPVGLRIESVASAVAALDRMRALERESPQDLRILRALRDSDTGRLLDLLDASRAQNRQDLFALAVLGFKRGGFFVEFGATNGVKVSNTYLLEREFGWRGIVAEPARSWHADLRRNRRCAVDTRCVWSRTGELLDFVEPTSAGLSTIAAFADSDDRAPDRREGTRYRVESVSLDDLLEHWSAPDEIDYLSIDTEGSELEILEAFDFSHRRVSVITCEHNHTPRRDAVAALLGRYGFVRVHEDVSGVDDWFVHSDLLARSRPDGP